jgi:hypothetical protein
MILDLPLDSDVWSKIIALAQTSEVGRSPVTQWALHRSSADRRTGTRPAASPLGRCHTVAPQVRLEEQIPLESLENQMTEVLDRLASANKPKRLGRHRRNTLPRSARRTRSDRPSEPVSITDLNLTAEQYNQMLARVIPTLQPVGM